ncbi:MAG: hypothetical protein AAF236_14495 [Verrucomicrobiota bacterium]
MNTSRTLATCLLVVTIGWVGSPLVLGLDRSVTNSQGQEVLQSIPLQQKRAVSQIRDGADFCSGETEPATTSSPADRKGGADKDTLSQGLGEIKDKDELDVPERNPVPSPPPPPQPPRVFVVDRDNSLSLEPGARAVATLSRQSVSRFQEGGLNEVMVGGVPWVYGGMDGWMAIRKSTRNVDYARDNGDGTLTLTWDGGGDPSDAFISLRPQYGLRGDRLAKMWTGSEVEVIDSNRVSSSGYWWIKVRLVGWVPRSSASGNTLLREL